MPGLLKQRSVDCGLFERDYYWCVYKTQYRVSQIDFLPTQTFEYGVWKLTLSDSEYIYLVGIYHPPPSKINQSNNSFVDEISCN